MICLKVLDQMVLLFIFQISDESLFPDTNIHSKHPFAIRHLLSLHEALAASNHVNIGYLF